MFFAYLFVQFAAVTSLSTVVDSPQYNFVPSTGLNTGCLSSQRASRCSGRGRSFGRELVERRSAGNSGQEGAIHPRVTWVLHPATPPGSRGRCSGGTCLGAPGTALVEAFRVSAGAGGPRICPSISIQSWYPLARAAGGRVQAGVLSAHLECFIP